MSKAKFVLSDEFSVGGIECVCHSEVRKPYRKFDSIKKIFNITKQMLLHLLLLQRPELRLQLQISFHKGLDILHADVKQRCRYRVC